MYLSIIVPCYNEESVIEENIHKICNYLKSTHEGITFEVIAINDGSADGTLSILKRLEKEIDIFRHEDLVVNQGRGAAMKRGMSSSTGKFIMFLDADLSYDVNHISKVINKIEEDSSVDAIVISPYMKGGVAQNIPFTRLLLSRIANWILSGFFSNQISTVTSMVRAYRGDVIRNLPLYESGKELHLEILRKLNLVGAKIIEIPGSLIWKEKKSRGARLNKKKVASSAGKHLLYGFLAKPTRFLRTFSFIILFLGVYEAINVLRLFFSKFAFTDAGMVRDIWTALSITFSSSPHTVVIAVVFLIIALQLLSFLSLFTVLRMQHEENLRHILAVLEGQRRK